MASINYATREISCKIVYYGPGLSGKTTNLQIIHRKIPDKDKSEMVSLATETDRTLFFDFLPLDLGSIKGFNTKFQLYTVPGQVYYNATRKLVLRGVDGVVFVVDSQVDKLQENLESFANLQENLREYGHSIENIPLVLQYNKRDLPNVYPVEQLNSLVNKHNLPYYEAVAATGVGVFTTLKAIGKSVIDKFNAKYAGFQGTRRPARPEAPAAPKAAPPSFGQPAAPAPQPGGFGAPAAQPFPNFPAPGQPPAPRAPQPQSPAGFPGAAPGGFGNPAPGGFNPPAGGFGAPASPGFGNAPAQPNPFMNQPSGLPTSAGFPGPAAKPAPITGPAAGAPAFGAPTSAPGGFNPPPGFGAGQGSPFAAPPGGPAKPGFPGGPAPFPPAGAAPGPQAPGQGPGGIPNAFPFPNKPTPMPPAGGFNQPSGIPTSPFVESFGGQPGPANPPSAPAAPAGNPFGGGANVPPAFGQGKPAGGFNPFPGISTPPSPGPQNPLQGGPANQGSPFAAPGGLGAPPSGGFGGFNSPAPSGFGGPSNAPGQGGLGASPSGFGAPQGGFGGNAGPGQGFGNMGGAPFQAPQDKSPFPTLQNPNAPMQNDPGAGNFPPQGRNVGGIEDNSGIVTTYEDMAKDDSFKTKKLPHPNDKKKGFFDGLFNKEKK